MTNRLTNALLVGIFIALVGIGFELHRVANFFTGPLTTRRAIATVAAPAPETRAERSERLRREADEAAEDLSAMLTPSKKK